MAGRDFWNEVSVTPAEVGSPLPAVAAKAMKRGFVDGFFVVDKTGIVRFARTGFGMELLPSSTEVVRLLDELEARR